MGSAFSLGKVFGIQFRLHYTWFIIFVLISISLSWQYLPFTYPDWNLWTYWTTGIVTSLLFFASVVAHELAHSLVGRANSIPIKSITLFIFGGVSHMTKEATHPGAEFKMAVAGPACSLVIGGVFFLVQLLIRGISEPTAAMAFWLAQINVMLAIFNLIPGFPLDGGRVFRSILWRFTGQYMKSTRIATRVGRGVGYLFILGGILIIFLLNDAWFSGLWLALIGWFLENAASASYRQAKWQGALQSFTASQVMSLDYPVVPSDITINQLVKEYVFTTGRRFFMVADEGGLEGIITMHNIKPISQQCWDTTQVRELMTPVDKVKITHADQEVQSILEQMNEQGINQMPVVSKEGKVIGLITRDNLARLLRTYAELGYK
ncbi:site-2 protease family protein [Chloroflexota bacterium]